MNRVFRSGRGNARTLSDRTLAAALLPATAVLIGAYQVTQASSASGGRWGILGDRDFYAAPGITSGGIGPATEPLMTPYVAGETAIVYLPNPGEEYAVALGAAAYVHGHELTIGTSGRFVPAVTGDAVVAHYDQLPKTCAAGELADVVIANAYRKA